MMRALFLISAAVVLGSCGAKAPEERRYAIRIVGEDLIRNSTVLCSDGNQIRMSAQGLTASGGRLSNSTIIVAWTILDENGKPKRCAPPEEAPPRVEEVPIGQ